MDFPAKEAELYTFFQYTPIQECCFSISRSSFLEGLILAELPVEDCRLEQVGKSGNAPIVKLR